VSCCNDKLFPKLQELLDYLILELAECDRMVCRSFITTAEEVPWDNCCTCDLGDGMEGNGQAWVAVSTIEPLNTLTSGQTSVCGHKWLATVRVGIVRCARGVLDDNGNPPTEDAVTYDAQQVLLDRLVILNAIRCGFGSVVEPSDVTSQPWTALGPSGGCVGGVQQFLFLFGDPKCTPTLES
jgi:hypothetical protein